MDGEKGQLLWVIGGAYICVRVQGLKKSRRPSLWSKDGSTKVDPARKINSRRTPPSVTPFATVKQSAGLDARLGLYTSEQDHGQFIPSKYWRLATTTNNLLLNYMI
ncbi:hypothetical protein TNCV_4427851 [Trichonephila clavipes]|nr:hypothetical protein TNCV_4427851 [Trichonephila clavipes]